MDFNSQWLMGWNDRMLAKYGQPKIGYDWCRKLAYAMNEDGNACPSADAIKKAKQWEDVFIEEDE